MEQGPAVFDNQFPSLGTPARVQRSNGAEEEWVICQPKDIGFISVSTIDSNGTKIRKDFPFGSESIRNFLELNNFFGDSRVFAFVSAFGLGHHLCADVDDARLFGWKISAFGEQGKVVLYHDALRREVVQNAYDLFLVNPVVLDALPKMDIQSKACVIGKEGDRTYGASPSSWGYFAAGSSYGISKESNTENDHNEDRVFIGKNGDRFAVIDGVGGFIGGEGAAEAVVSALDKKIPLEDVLAKASDIMRERKNFSGAAVAALLERRESGDFDCLVVGDCRCIMLKDGAIVGRTRDQTVVERNVSKGHVTEDEALFVENKHVVSNLVRYSGIKKDPNKYVIPNTFHGMLVVASDGVTDNITDEELAGLSVNRTPEEFVQIVIQVVTWRMKYEKSFNEVLLPNNLRGFSDGFRQPPKPDNISLIAVAV